MDSPATTSLTSAAFTNAILVAALALVGKVAYDAWVRFDQRRGVAGALVGEIGAYVEIILEMDLDANLLAWVNIQPEKREGILRAMAPFPIGHPVFDKIADKLMFLPPEQSIGISRFYNAVTSMRLLMTNMRSAEFIALQPEVQNANFRIVATLVGREFRSARDRLLPALRSLADETVAKSVGRKGQQLQNWLTDRVRNNR
jgi:hypothetical protein